MRTVLTESSDARTRDYVRQARRLRARETQSAARRVHALRNLARQSDDQPTRAPAERQHPDIAPSETFSRLVQARLDGPILRYSTRLSLFAAARRWGIPRFQANLIIAAVQHDARSQTPPYRPAPRPVAVTFAVVACVQSAIVLAAWWVLIG